MKRAPTGAILLATPTPSQKGFQMQIAVTSQDRKTITSHAGKCRKFWIYDVEKGEVVRKQLVELAIEQSFHANHHDLAGPLAGINTLITGGLGNGLYLRLMQSGILTVITLAQDPDSAVVAFLNNTLDRLPAPNNHECHDHAHHH